MKKTRFMMVGGFLGAGKTTTLAWLARHFQEQGKTVGVITNDQADDLVDTMTMRCLGLNVQQVGGACFCCKFDELVDRIQRLGTAPDIILAEPVGSCTDLVATVVRPLRRLYGDFISVAPFPVIFKPSHGMDALLGQPGGLSVDGAYIFRKQLEEADVLVINRVDQLSPADVEAMRARMDDVFHGVPLLAVSARTGQGMTELASLLEQESGVAQRVLALDYDRYAAGEAEMGWLNHTFRISGAQPFSLDAVLLRVLERVAALCAEQRADIAHIKAVGLTPVASALVNHVGGSTAPQLSRASGAMPLTADVVLNARVSTRPDALTAITQQALLDVAQAWELQVQPGRLQSLSPGRPQPTHRDGVVAGGAP